MHGPLWVGDDEFERQRAPAYCRHVPYASRYMAVYAPLFHTFNCRATHRLKSIPPTPHAIRFTYFTQVGVHFAGKRIRRFAWWQPIIMLKRWFWLHFARLLSISFPPEDDIYIRIYWARFNTKYDLTEVRPNTSYTLSAGLDGHALFSYRTRLRYAAALLQMHRCICQWQGSMQGHRFMCRANGAKSINAFPQKWSHVRRLWYMRFAPAWCGQKIS